MKIQAPDRAVRLASTAGVTLQLAAHEVRDVPQFLIATAFAQGCTPANGDPVPEPEPAAPSGTERDGLICEAIERIVERADPAEFTKQSPPRPKKGAVEAETGFTVTATEIDAAYALVVATEPGNDHEGE